MGGVQPPPDPSVSPVSCHFEPRTTPQTGRFGSVLNVLLILARGRAGLGWGDPVSCLPQSHPDREPSPPLGAPTTLSQRSRMGSVWWWWWFLGAACASKSCLLCFNSHPETCFRSFWRKRKGEGREKHHWFPPAPRPVCGPRQGQTLHLQWVGQRSSQRSRTGQAGQLYLKTVFITLELAC